MTDKEFLSWIADRLVYVYRESPNVDFVQKLRRIADASAPLEFPAIDLGMIPGEGPKHPFEPFQYTERS
jgi:hypothetical protein